VFTKYLIVSGMKQVSNLGYCK